MGFIKIQPPVLAHRGASEYAPENTLAAFTKAVQLGSQWIEFDVALTADHVPIIMHDETVERTTNGHGAVSALTLTEIKTLDAGSWFDPVYANERVPTLAETIALVADKKIHANVELKPLLGQEEMLVARVLAVMSDFLALNKTAIIFSSFNVTALDSLRQQSSDCQIGLLMAEVLPDWDIIAKRLHCAAINVNHEVMTNELAQLIKSKGYTLCCYTVNDIATAKKLYSWGVDAVFSNAPDRMMQLQSEPQSGYSFKLN